MKKTEISHCDNVKYHIVTSENEKWRLSWERSPRKSDTFWLQHFAIAFSLVAPTTFFCQNTIFKMILILPLRPWPVFNRTFLYIPCNSRIQRYFLDFFFIRNLNFMLGFFFHSKFKFYAWHFELWQKLNTETFDRGVKQCEICNTGKLITHTIWDIFDLIKVNLGLFSARVSKCPGTRTLARTAKRTEIWDSNEH